MKELKGKSKGSVVNILITVVLRSEGHQYNVRKKYSVSVRRNEMLEVLQSEGHQYNVRKYTVKVCEKMKCLRIQCAGRYSVCTQVTKYSEKKLTPRKDTMCG